MSGSAPVPTTRAQREQGRAGLTRDGPQGPRSKVRCGPVSSGELWKHQEQGGHMVSINLVDAIWEGEEVKAVGRQSRLESG